MFQNALPPLPNAPWEPGWLLTVVELVLLVSRLLELHPKSEGLHSAKGTPSGAQGVMTVPPQLWPLSLCPHPFTLYSIPSGQRSQQRELCAVVCAAFVLPCMALLLEAPLVNYKYWRPEKLRNLGDGRMSKQVVHVGGAMLGGRGCFISRMRSNIPVCVSVVSVALVAALCSFCPHLKAPDVVTGSFCLLSSLWAYPSQEGIILVLFNVAFPIPGTHLARATSLWLAKGHSP